MDQAYPSGPAQRLLGRGLERAAIERLLEHARDGSGGALVLRGEAGIGKSALLDYAAGSAAQDMLVLRSVGAEAEAELTFSGLYGLVRPVLDRLGELPSVQSEALAAALGVGPPAAPDRFLIYAATLGLLAAAAEQRPVLCLLDDAQWLDTPSAEALVFTARRLNAERVAMLFAAREGEPRRFEASGLEQLQVTGLDDAAATGLLAGAAATASGAVRSRLLEEASGNPLALIELPAALTPAQLAGEDALPDAMPLTPRLEALFRARIDELPSPTRRALLIAALDDTASLPVLMKAVAVAQLPRDVFDPAEEAGLIAIGDGELGFRHPLVRSALHESATLSQRQSAHESLVAALEGDEHMDRRVWHQAMASLTADEGVADALEASARRAQVRGGHASATTAFERAAQLSTDATSGARRLAAAAQAAWDAGQVERARDLIARAHPVVEGQDLAGLMHLRGVIEARAGQLGDAVPYLIEAADACQQPSLQLEILLEAAEAASFAGLFAQFAGLDQRAGRIDPSNDRDQFIIAVLAGFSRAFSGDFERSRAWFEKALALAPRLDDPRALTWASASAEVSGALGDGLPYSARAVELARQKGLLSLLPLTLEQHALVLIATSNFDLAYAAAEEGLRLSREFGLGQGWHLANMASVEVVWGRENDARNHCEESLQIGRRTGRTFLTSVAEWNLGMLELCTGRPERAADHMLTLTNGTLGQIHPIVAVSAVPDAVEAVVRAGRAEEARAPFARYRMMASTAPTANNRALCARCEAQLGERPPAVAFAEAVELAEALSPLERARTQLVYGEWLRRERKRQEARVLLRAAWETFHALGAVPWEERARGELRATGETTRKREPSTRDDLTPQEHQIAMLVAEGMTNRDIAAQLYLSPRTIDYHLRKVFAKLGIASRGELVRSRQPLLD